MELGEILKRQAGRASLQRPLDSQIQTPQQLYEWAKKATQSATSDAEVLAEENCLCERMEASLTIEGTHSYHAFYPLKECSSKLQVKEYSRSHYSEIVKVSSHRDLISMT